MHIDNGSAPNDVGKYIIGTVAVIFMTILGQLPMMVPMLIKSIKENVPIPTNNIELLTFLDPNTTLFFMLLPFAFGLATLYFIVRYLHRQSFESLTTGRSKTDWARVMFSFGLWSAILTITLGISYYAEPELYQVTFEPVPFAILAVIAVIMVPIQTSAEEYLFRGYLLQGIASVTRERLFPLLITSFAFGIMHIANPEVDKIGNIIMIYYIGTGLFLGIITLMDDGLELSLGFHASNNLIGALLVTTDWTAFQTPSILKDISEPTIFIDILIPIFIIFPIVLLIYSRKYRWTGWREKLTGRIYTNSEKTS